MLAQTPSTNPTAYFWWEPAFPAALRSLLFVALPPLSLIKLLSDISIFTGVKLAFNATTGQAQFTDAAHFDWHALSTFTHNRTASVLPTGSGLLSETLFAPPPPSESVGFLCLSMLLSYALAWYCNLIAAYGAKPQPLHFFLRPSFWFPASVKGGSRLASLRAGLRRRLREDALPANADADVKQEIHTVWSADGLGGASVHLLDLHRAFTTWVWRRRRWFHLPLPQPRRFEAVKGLTVAFHSGQVFALLGHNGAGKTTTFMMLGAQLEPSGGDVDLHGTSARGEASTVRAHLGICPQHDILLPELTAREHLQLYGSLTGMSSEECTRCIPQLLHQVRTRASVLMHCVRVCVCVRACLPAKGSARLRCLCAWRYMRTAAPRTLATLSVRLRSSRVRAQVRLDGALADKPAGSFSGGMQRRLSVAAAFIGNPIGSQLGHQKVVMLDEPSTGMDPMNRKRECRLACWPIARTRTRGTSRLASPPPPRPLADIRVRVRARVRVLYVLCVRAVRVVADVWDLVRMCKRECTVVLTTHSMEEADALGDRIGIMSSGALVALGTSLHLKTKYGEVRHAPESGRARVQGGEGVQLC